MHLQKMFSPEGAFVLQEKFYKHFTELQSGLKFKRAGARKEIYCDPKQTKVAIATCGGICPGMNVVIRALYKCLKNEYGVEDIYGVRWGFYGFATDFPKHWIKLDDQKTYGIQNNGGSMLGTSGDPRVVDKEAIVKSLEDQGITQVYLIGGAGTHKGLRELQMLIRKKQLKISLIGIPTTIDNNVPFVD